MKKIISVLLVAAALLTFAACTSASDSTTSPDASPSASDTAPDGNSPSAPSTPPSGTPAASTPPASTPKPSDPPASKPPATTPTPSKPTPSAPAASTPPPESAPPSEAPPATGGSGGLSGTPEEILTKLMDDLKATDIEMPMCLPPMAVTADKSQNAIGLSEADFGKYVTAAADTMAAIGTFAHQIIIIQGVDAAAATQIKKIVSGTGGYDPKKWVCVYPEKAIAIEAGNYVMIVAAKNAVADAAVDIFKATAGNAGDANVFWDFSE